MAIQIQYRRDTAANWTSVNPVLAEGEPGYETDTGKFKVGTGSATWTALSYASGPAGATGPTGAAGATGATGATGAAGVGVPVGGTAGQVLSKIDATNYNTQWITAGGSGTVTSIGGTGTVNGLTLTGTVTTSGNLTLGGTLSGIANTALTNSAITINGTSTSLGGSISVGTVTGVTATSPVVSSGGTAPVISMAKATTSVDGYLSATDWTTFNNKQPAGSYLTSGGALGTPSSGTVTNLTGTASININGTVGATTASTGAFTYISTNSATSVTPTLSFNASNSPYAAGATISGSYLQHLLQNKSNTAGASTNYVLSNDLGTDSTYYGEFGMNSSAYSSGTPTDFFSINNGIYFSGHDGDMTIGSGNGFKTYLAWGTAGQSAHVINATGSIGLNTSITGSTNYGTAGQVLTSQGSTSSPTWTTVSSGGVSSVTGTAPVVSSGGTTPAISMAKATTSVDGYLSAADWTTFNGKQPAGSYLTSGGALGTPSSGTLTNVTGLPVGGISATGTPSIATYLRGDGTWSAPVGAGTVTSVDVSGGITGLTTSGGPITGTGTITLAGSLALTNGGTGKTTAPAGHANLTGYATTATAAGTTTLTNTSSYIQYFTGTSTQTVVMPVTSTLATGWSFHIANNSTAPLTLQSSGANVISTVAPNTTTHITCIGTALTTAADWDAGSTDFGTLLGNDGAVPFHSQFYLSAAGSALTGATQNYFGANSAVSLDAASAYDIEAYCYFLKTTAGTVQWIPTFSSAITAGHSYLEYTPVTGFTTTVITGTMVTAEATQQTTTVLTHAATASLTTAVYHIAKLKIRVITNAACNFRLNNTIGTGSITPQAGSFYTARKVITTAGTFVA